MEQEFVRNIQTKNTFSLLSLPSILINPIKSLQIFPLCLLCVLLFKRKSSLRVGHTKTSMNTPLSRSFVSPLRSPQSAAEHRLLSSSVCAYLQVAIRPLERTNNNLLSAPSTSTAYFGIGGFC